MARPEEPEIADVVIRVLDALPPGGHALIGGDATGRIAAALAARPGPAPTLATTWLRRATVGAAPPAPWPTGGPFDAAILRLPKARAELEMASHALLSLLRPGAPLWIYGANDEGIKGAIRTLAPLVGDVATLDTRRHCRILAASRPTAVPDLRARLSDWRTTISLTLDGAAQSFASYPGLFAHGRLDDGTRLLLAHLPAIAPTARVLDYGTGIGVLAAVVRRRLPQARVVALDADSVALEAVRENVAGAALSCGCRIADAGPGPFDLILSNPPIHDGKAEDHTALSALVATAPAHLHRGGRLVIVVQRRLRAAGLIGRAFGNCETVAQTGVFEVLAATRRA